MSPGVRKAARTPNKARAGARPKSKARTKVSRKAGVKMKTKRQTARPARPARPTKNPATRAPGLASEAAFASKPAASGASRAATATKLAASGASRAAIATLPAILGASQAATAAPPAPAGRPRAELDDAQLVTLAQGGDNRAFDELVKRYKDKVYRLSFKILRHEEDASESLQDAFLSAYRGLKNFKSESTFSTWLYRIATNASLMKYRKRRENHVSLEQSQSRNDDAEPLEVPDWSTQPVDELLTAETREVMEDSVAKLPEELQTVFLMRDIQEQSNAEVAAALDLSVAAVKSRLHRARLLLRDRLNRYFADRMTRKDRAR